jgi:hypothetical protein
MGGGEMERNQIIHITRRSNGAEELDALAKRLYILLFL